MRNATIHPKERQTKEKLIFESYPVPKAVAAMVLPTIISQVVHVIYNVADTWYVGLTQDPNAVAAISLCLPLCVLMTSISNLFGIGGDSVIARALGAGDHEKTRRAFAVAFWSALAAAAVYSFALLLVGHRLLLLIGGTGGNIGYALHYMRVVIILGAPAAILTAAIGHLIRATGESRAASMGLTLGAILNMIFDPLFMFVVLPKGNEVIGAAIATMLSNVISMSFFLIHLYRHRKNGVYSIHIGLLKGAKNEFFEILRCGLPSFTTMSLATISNCFLNAMVSMMGSSAAVAGMGIVRKVDSLAFSVNQGVTQGMLPLVSYCYASRRKERMFAIIRLSAVFTVAFSLLSTLISVLFAPQLITIFIKDTETIRYGAAFLRVVCLAVPIYSFTYVIIAVFQAVGRSREPLCLSIIRRGLFDIVLLFLIRRVFGLQYVTWASPITEAIALMIAIVLFVRLFKGHHLEVSTDPIQQIDHTREE